MQHNQVEFAGVYVLAILLSAFSGEGIPQAFASPLLFTLGVPWTLFLNSLNSVDYLSGVTPYVLALLACALNLAILFSFCTTLRRRRTLLRPEN